MPSNSLNLDGLTIQTLNEILEELRNGTTDFPGLRDIYGEDINLDPNSPDGQLINIVAQAKLDMLELILQVFSSFDPDQAVGVNLDRRCAINGVKRAGGTRTVQYLTITFDRSLTLPGMDTDNPFTVSDAEGNQYRLVASQDFVGPGSSSVQFQAVEVGPVTSALNSITNIVTVTLGIVSVNNPTAADSVGVAQESDAALRTRRARSVSIPSQGYIEGLISSLLALDDVTQVEVYENVTDDTDLRDIPPHAIWVIIEGGDEDEIANVINIKRSLGCNMKGDVEVNVIQRDGYILTIKFDRPIDQDLYIKFDAEAIIGAVDIDNIRAHLLQQLTYGINQAADSSRVVALVKEIAPNVAVSNEGVSLDDSLYESLVVPTTVQHKFNVVQIEINGTIS